MRKYFPAILFGFLSAYSITVSFHFPFHPEAFSETVDFITASVYELLGQYSFAFAAVWLLCIVFYLLLDKKGYSFLDLLSNKNGKPGILNLILSVVFAFTLTLGVFFNQVETYIVFGSFVNSLKAFLVTAGYTFLLFPSLCYFTDWYDGLSVVSEDNVLFENHAFIKIFAVLAVFYLPFLIMSFPGNLCYDSIGQINQVLNGGYSAHHPLMLTLVMGGLVKFGTNVLSSYAAGLFIYTCLQTVFFLLSLSACIYFFAKKQVNKIFLIILMLLYCITPIYTNLATTAIKDIPYTSFCMLYLIVLSLAVSKPEYVKNIKFHIVFVLLQIGVIFTRNNGLPLIVLSGIGALLYLIIKKNKISVILLSALAFFAESAVIGVLLLNITGNALNAKSISKGEILSLPFQQTAYYLLEGGEMTNDELAVLEKVLDKPEVIMENYDPKLADPVKALYKSDCTKDDMIAYLKVWAKCGLKHPTPYIKAFLVHTYGWYSPAVTGSVRYENDYDGILLFPDSNKVMIFLYRFASRFTPLAILESIGLAAWFLLILTVYMIKRKKEWIITLPLWVTFLICLTSPCFFNHPRYGLPILCGIPFLYLFTKVEKAESQKEN